MQMHASSSQHEVQISVSRVGGTNTGRQIHINLFATLALILALVGLSSCAGFTSAAGNGQPGTPSAGVLSPSSDSLRFGNISMGNTATKSLTVKNTGTATVNISGATISGAGFTVVGGNPSSSIPVGQSGTIQVQFAPQSAGAETGNLSVVSDASNSPLTVPLSGVGTPPGLTMTPSSVSFGNVTIGQSNTQTVKLTNSESTNLVVSGATVTGGGFSISGLALPTSLSASQSLSFTVHFQPAAAGGVSGGISFTNSGPESPQVLPLTGTGILTTELLAASPLSLNFGNVNDGTNSSQKVTLANTGNSNVTISSISTSGRGFSANGISSGLTLGPSQTATLQVIFAPMNPGGVSGSVTVASNATNSPATVTLSGTGVQVTSHTVALNWTASASSGVTGYNVYRGTTPGSYSKVTSSQVPGTAYTDPTVQSGQNITYYYVVTAVNSSNEESTDSNMASVLVP